MTSGKHEKPQHRRGEGEKEKERGGGRKLGCLGNSAWEEGRKGIKGKIKRKIVQKKGVRVSKKNHPRLISRKAIFTLPFVGGGKSGLVLEARSGVLEFQEAAGGDD